MASSARVRRPLPLLLSILIVVAMAGATFAAAARAAAGPSPAAPPDKWQSLPGDESDSVRALIDAAQEALDGGRSASAVLSDPSYDEVRSYPRFREVIRAHAPVGEATMISPREPGERLTLTFRLGKPGQMIYAYHTDARGAYGKSGVHFQANSGDVKYARLFTYIKTGADGSATLHTIRPAGYPQGELPQHVHFHVEPGRVAVGEIWFSDDPRLTPAMRERGQGEALIVTPAKTKDGWSATATLELQGR